MTGAIERLEEWHGFIRGDDHRTYFFFHNAMQMTSTAFADLQEGQRVQFIPLGHPKGLRAIEVRVIP
jgi:cold shock CspA family protein